MGQRNFKKQFEFRNFNKIFYFGMTRLRNTSSSVLISCQYIRTILTNKNMGQSLFKKHSKFQTFDEILYCDMTRLRNTILNYCGLCRYMKVTKSKKVVRQSLFKNQKKIEKFNIQLIFFTVTQPKVATNNTKFLENRFMQKLL